MEGNNWYIYRHLKPCGEVFYIGIGKTKNYARAYNKYHRSRWWKNVYKKYPNYEVQILTIGLSKEGAKELEIILIRYYGRKDLGTGTLVNLTDGGEGLLNVSEDIRKRHSERMKGENNPSYGIQNFGSNNPNYGNRWNEIQRQNNSKKLKAYFANNPQAIEALKNRVVSDETRRKISENANKPCGCDHKESKEVINLQTGIVHCSSREASDTYGFKRSTLKSMLNGTNKNWTDLRYLENL